MEKTTPPMYNNDGANGMNNNGMNNNGMQQPTVIQGQGQQMAVQLTQLSDHPACVDCPSCGTRAVTNIEFVSGNTTKAWGLGLCITTCCCCIPFFINGTKDVVHKCGNCSKRLATWHRSNRVVIDP